MVKVIKVQKLLGMFVGVILSGGLCSTTLATTSTAQKWTPALTLKVKRLSDLAYSPTGQQLLYTINSIDLKSNHYLQQFMVMDSQGKHAKTLLKASSDISSPQWSPNGRMIAYLSSQSGHSNIWMVDVNTDKTWQVTHLQNDIDSFKWAPNSKQMAFVMQTPVVDPSATVDASHAPKFHLWLLNLNANNQQQGHAVKLTPNTFSVSDWSGNWAYDWSPDSKTIVFARQAEPGLDAWTKAGLATINVATGKIQAIATTNHFWKYFPKYSPDGKWIAFINAGGPFKWSFLWHISVVPAKGGNIIRLSDSKQRSPFLWQWAADSKSVYYIENKGVIYTFNRMPIDGGKPQKILGNSHNLNVPGINAILTTSMVSVNPRKPQFAFIGQTYNKPPEVYVSPLTSFKPKKITFVNQAFKALPIGKTQLIHWQSKDHTKVEGLLTYPVNYQKNKKYPLIVQIHGGPNAADFNEYLPLMRFFTPAVYSTEGYFVLRVNYRGSLGYGVKFREQLVGNVGVLDYQDIMSGVDYVVDQGLVNPAQLFVVGQSNGGSLTNWIVTQTKRFKAACSIAGETDYISLEGTNGYFQTSWYMGGSYMNHLQKFIQRSPIFHVKNVTTPILIEGGLLDDNVPHGQLTEFYRALKRVGVTTKLISYPNSTHDFYPPKLYLQLLQSCNNWVNKYR